MNDETQHWIRQQLELAVESLTESGIYDDPMIEVKPAWALPLRILVGMARLPSQPQQFTWFFSGEIGFDHLPGEVASTPQEALRHLSMKWQLDAERLDGDAARERIELAEDIYDLATDERFWDSNLAQS